MAKTFNTGLSADERINKHKRSKAEVARMEEAKELAGNMSRKITADDMPPYFEGLQAQKFMELVELFENLPVNLHDLSAVERYCVLYDEFVNATMGIREFGLMIEGKKNPLITVRNDAARELRSLETHLQMTPSLRMKAINEQLKDEEEKDPFQSLFEEGK